MQKKWYIGCSGFYYREWKGVFYPEDLPSSKWFGYYCQHFNTLELNVTFYRFPQLKTLQGWHQKSPPHFLFAVKAPRTITHIKKFTDVKTILTEFYDVVTLGLEEKLGPVLFQLPPKFEYSQERLHNILDHLNPAYNNVIEFRNSSWWRQDVMDELGKHNITFCGVSYPGINDEVVINTPQLYYRFHGVPKLFYSAYDNAFLESRVHDITENDTVQNAFLYFNNTASSAALGNARFVQELIK